MDAVLDWLLEVENPSARTLALRHLLERRPGDPDVAAAQAAIPGWGPARDILAAQWPAGYWIAPGPGYSPKHRATVWQVIFLAALGAPRTSAIDAACAYVLDRSRLPDGRFSAGKTARQASASLNGSLLRAFRELGYEDARLREAAEALANMVLRTQFQAPAGPERARVFLTEAARALGGLAAMPRSQRSPVIEEALGVTVEVLLREGGQALLGGRETRDEREPWLHFGFPPGDTGDLVEAAEALQAAGHGADPRLAEALDVVRRKQDRDGRWVLERVPGNTWASFGEVGRPNKWVTIQALRVLTMEESL